VLSFNNVKIPLRINKLENIVNKQCMAWNPSREANIFSPGQKIPCILLTTKAHYLPYTSLPLYSILSRINPFYNIPSYIHKILFNMIVPRTPAPFKRIFSFCLSHQNFTFHVLHATTITSSLVSSPEHYVYRDVQITNLSGTYFYSVLRRFFPLWSKHFPLYCVLRHPQTIKKTVFWFATLCSWFDGHRPFREIFSFIFILTVSNHIHNSCLLLGRETILTTIRT
jgi:hypothetical protein